MSVRGLPLLEARVVLAVAGALMFGYGVRADVEGYRWAGIGCFVVALLLRWWPRGSDDAPPPPSTG